MIEFRDVSFSYPNGAEGGLKHIDLTIPGGQCVLLCGRSGCGKTTLARLINGLILQFFAGELSGRVLLDGEDITDLPMYRIAEKAGSVFQNPRTQFFNVDTDSEIAFGMENGAVPQEQLQRRVAETAGALRIDDLLGRSIFALSGGEKQKIAFASVYAMEPEIYLLDEPSSNLDMAAVGGLREHLRLIRSQGKTAELQRKAAASSVVSGRELLVFDEPTSGLDYDSMVRLASLIRRLADSGRIIFVVTHDYEFVCRTCTRILHLADGGIREDLTMAEGSLPTIKGLFGVQ